MKPSFLSVCVCAGAPLLAVVGIHHEDHAVDLDGLVKKLPDRPPKEKSY